MDKYSFPVHSNRLFCGVKEPLSASNRFGVFADLLATRPGDFVFFYQRRVDEGPKDRGFRGVYRVAGPPFVDESTVDSGQSRVLGQCPACRARVSEKATETEDGSASAICPKCRTVLDPTQHILPNRLPLELVTYFPEPVDDNSAYIDRTDPGTLWTLIFRKQWGPGRERSINHMLPEEAAKIRRLLARVNPSKLTEPPPGFPAGYPKTKTSPLPFEIPKRAPFSVESILYAWMNQNIDSNDRTVRSLLGPSSQIEYFGNQVLYGIGGDTADYLVLHSKRRGEQNPFDSTGQASVDRDIVEQDGRFAITVIEIKKEEVDLDTLNQVDRYAYYVGQVASANGLPHPPARLLVRPILLGFGAEASLLREVKSRTAKTIELSYPGGVTTRALVTPPKVVTYGVTGGKLVPTIVV